MKKQVPYTFHKWSIYIREWVYNNIQNIPEKLDKIKTSIPHILICKGVDKKRTRKTLRDSFKIKGIPFGAYCLTGGIPEDTCVLCRFGLFFWRCYYVEKGKKWDKRVFFTQNQACFYLYYSILINFEKSVDLTKTEQEKIKKFKYAAKGIMKT